MDPRETRLAWISLGAFAGLAALLVVFYPDSYQQDAGYHFLFARWAWVHPELLVGVWSRPAFTLLYSLPAQLGYPAAKLFTALVCGACAWQTWRLAVDLRLARPHLAVALLVLQPSFFLLCTDTLTEPLFALLFVVALRLHHAGRVRAGMIVASCLVLARPEGFFIGVLWGVWILVDRRDPRPLLRRIPSTLWLATGSAAWWLAALLITGDPLFIKHNWPPDWIASGGPYGSGPIWAYIGKLPEITGPLLAIPFLFGVGVLVSRRRLGMLTSSVLLVLILHSILWSYGGFGSAGYPRYMVTVAPAIALIILEGWNAAALPHVARRAIGGVALAASFAFCAIYVDALVFSRDAHVANEVRAEFEKSPRPYKRFVWSQAYMAILFDADPWSGPPWGDLHKNLKLIRELPSGTLVFWDSETGPAWYRLGRNEFENAGFEVVAARERELQGYFVKGTILGFGGPRRQAMCLLYKP
jgi:hypothetical protein